MAKGGNTWCKKLMTKGKQHALKSKLGTFKPHSIATSQDEAVEIKRVREFNAPMVKNFQPQGWGKRGHIAPKLSHEKRLSILLRAEQKELFERLRNEARREFFGLA